jgi:hypothetical protein
LSHRYIVLEHSTPSWIKTGACRVT